MTSIDKLRYITNLLFKKLEDTCIDLTQEESDNVVNFNNDLRKDLNRLEKLEKVIEILKPFFKNKICKEESGIEWYGFKEEPSYVIWDNEPFPLEKDQYDLLKEVFDDDK